MRVVFGVLGPVAAWDDAGRAIALKGPRHRAVLARLIVARGRVVPVDPPGRRPVGRPAAGRGGRGTHLRGRAAPRAGARPPAARTRPGCWSPRGRGTRCARSRTRSTPGGSRQAVAAAATLPPEACSPGWRRRWAGGAGPRTPSSPTRTGPGRSGPAWPSCGCGPSSAGPRRGWRWAAPPRRCRTWTRTWPSTRWREDAWRLLALALYRTGRQGDALAVLRRARTLLVEQLGVDPGPALRRLETDILDQADHLDRRAGRAAGRVWAQAAAAYDRTVASGARARLESTVGLLRNLAVTGGGGLEAARRHRRGGHRGGRGAGRPGADRPGDRRVRRPGDLDPLGRPGAGGRRSWRRPNAPWPRCRPARTRRRGPGCWPRSPWSRAAPARRAGPRGRRGRRRRSPAAWTIPALLAFALNGVFMQTFHRAGLAPRRDEIGAELVALSARHGLVTFEVLGHLIRLQARSALADFPAADEHAAAADRAGRAARAAAGGRVHPVVPGAAARRDRAGAAEAEAAYRDAAARLDGAGMPGLRARRCCRSRCSACACGTRCPPRPTSDTDWGPYEPWARPLVLLAQDRRDEAAAALRRTPDPPRDLLFEALWCLAARAAIAVGDRETMERAHAELLPAAAELAGAGSGLLTLGPVSEHLAALGSVR